MNGLRNRHKEFGMKKKNNPENTASEIINSGSETTAESYNPDMNIIAGVYGPPPGSGIRTGNETVSPMMGIVIKTESETEDNGKSDKD